MGQVAFARLIVSTAPRENNIAISGRVKTRQELEAFIGELNKLSPFLYDTTRTGE